MLAADPRAAVRRDRSGAGAGHWVALAADYALGACFEPAVPPAPRAGRCCGPGCSPTPSARCAGVDAFLAEQLAAIPEYQRLAGIAELSAAVDAAKHAAQVRQILSLDRRRRLLPDQPHFSADFPLYGHPLALYARLRERQPVRYGGFRRRRRGTILSFSPELFFERWARGS
jgi:para-aminobenzoate synthetase/4-amino-4-deoxychorismate lyase